MIDLETVLTPSTASKYAPDLRRQIEEFRRNYRAHSKSVGADTTCWLASINSRIAMRGSADLQKEKGLGYITGIDPNTDCISVIDGTVFMNRGNGSPTPLRLHHVLSSKERPRVSWSPDGKHLAIEGLFERAGDCPVSRVCLVNVDTATHSFLAFGSPTHKSVGPCDSTPHAILASAWDASSRLFTFIGRSGLAYTDVYVTNPYGTMVTRLTSDRDLKWAPAIDPSGERVAFLNTPRKGDKLLPEFTTIRIRHLYSGIEHIVPARGFAMCQELTWIPDGSGLLLTWQKSSTDTAGVIALFDTPKHEENDGLTIAGFPVCLRRTWIIMALGSADPSLVEAGANEIDYESEIDLVLELRKAINWAVINKHKEAQRALLRAIVRLDAREAKPQVMRLRHSGDETVRCMADKLIEAWRFGSDH